MQDMNEKYTCPRTDEACRYLNDPKYHRFANPDRFVDNADRCTELLNNGFCGFLNLVGMMETILQVETSRRVSAHEDIYEVSSMSDEQRDNSSNAN